MSRALQGGTTDQLYDTGDLDILKQGAQLLMGDKLQGMSNFFGGGGSKKKEKQQDLDFEEDSDDGRPGAREDDSAEYDSEDDYDSEEDADADGAMNRFMGDDEDDEEGEDEDDDGLFESAGALLGMGMAGAADKFGLRRKTFVCNLHHIRLTNLVRRRRDVLLHFTLGAHLAEAGSAVIIGGESTPSAAGDAGGDAAAGDNMLPADATAAAASAAGAAAAATPAGDDPAGAKKGRFRRAPSFRRSGRSKTNDEGSGSGGGASGATSKPVLFKTDVAVKPERNKAVPLRATFSGKWRGRYEDLPNRVLQMALYEQTRFGNLVEIGQAAIPLLELATGSVQQEITFIERDGRTTIEVFRCNFHCHFQEKFTYVLRLLDWKGSNLRATDDSNSSDPYLKFHIRGARARGYAPAAAHRCAPPLALPFLLGRRRVRCRSQLSALLSALPHTLSALTPSSPGDRPSLAPLPVAAPRSPLAVARLRGTPQARPSSATRHGTSAAASSADRR
jgi:hypothetical protein